MTLLRVALLLLAFPALAWAQPLSPTENYRGETVRLLEIVSGSASAVQVRSATVVLKADGSEQVEETVMRFRPVSFWRTDVEVDQSREVKPAPGGAAQPRSSAPTVRFTLER